jgi:hypothetical protein
LKIGFHSLLLKLGVTAIVPRKAMSGAHLSKDFFELIKNIGECKSKQVRASPSRAPPRGPPRR